MKTRLLFATLIILAVFLTACEKQFINDPADPLQSSLKNKNAEMIALKTFDEWGFNWNAHHFDGYLVNAILADHMFMGYPHYKKTIYNGEGIEFWNNLLDSYSYFAYFMPDFLLDCHVVMHWNEALISSEGVYEASWTGTDAWITFKFRGENNGESWSHFRKLVAVSETDSLYDDGTWHNAAGAQIGLQSDWAELMVIQVVNTGAVPPVFYAPYRSPAGSGLGTFKP